MAMSAKRTAQRFAQKLNKLYGVQITETEALEALYESMIEEIKNHMEAQNLQVPALGFTYIDNNGTTNTTKNVEGNSTTGTIKRGGFR